MSSLKEPPETMTLSIYSKRKFDILHWSHMQAFLVVDHKAHKESKSNMK